LLGITNAASAAHGLPEAGVPVHIPARSFQTLCSSGMTKVVLQLL
jgi:hypothetical protein